MPALVRLYLRQVALGFLLGGLFTLLLLLLDVGGLGHLVTHVRGGGLAVFLLFAFNGIVFGGAQFGIRVMGLAAGEGDVPPAARLPAPPAVGPAPPRPVAVAVAGARPGRGGRFRPG